ncbi:MlaD family protein [Flavihumibacter rivuli]|uniref:MlaD family protein n=1 Tax=Flavihumibacter rivuli TaxID=2838156 RepID=UPI001BDF5564|nr:MlaD family protein [Flavihumibacter rivuli]ULQ58230.1 MlaD family protein [Flavihumibacter rivuli]
MARESTNNLKLGLFTLAGILFLVLTLYMIGKDRNLFGSNIWIKARFTNASGLVVGNNVRYSGIQVGTVKEVDLINDTTIEITMLIDSKASKNILKNAFASIGTEGMIGNKVVNINPGKGSSTPIEEGDFITVKRALNTDEMLETLAYTNQNIATISDELKSTIHNINKSTALWNLLRDDTIRQDLKKTVATLRRTTEGTEAAMQQIQQVISDVKDGKGNLGKLLMDTALVGNLESAIANLQTISTNAELASVSIRQLTDSINREVVSGKGTVNMVLKDTALTRKIQNSMTNIEKGTEAFNQNMEAAKHNWLFRGYFKKQEKQRIKDSIQASKQ